MEILKDVVGDLKQIWGEAPTSVRFWYGVLLLFIVSVGIYDLGWFITLMIGMSFIAFFAILHSLSSYAPKYYYMWIGLTPLGWALGIILLLMDVSTWVYYKTVNRFNEWLNNKF